MTKKLKYSFQSNLLSSYQSFSSHIPFEAYKNAVSLSKLDEYFEKCMYFDGEFSWQHDAIIIPGNMKAFSFNDENQNKNFYIFARYGSSARRQVIEAMSHYHAMISFKYSDEINQLIHDKFEDRQAFKKYFSFYYQKALSSFNDLEKLNQQEIEFCKSFIFPRPEKLFLPRKYDPLTLKGLDKKLVVEPACNRDHALNGSIIYNMGKRKEAKQYLAYHLQKSPKSISIGRRLGFLLLNEGETEKGKRVLARYLNENHKDYPLASYQMSRLTLRETRTI